MEKAMIVFEYDEDGEAEGVRPPISYKVKGETAMSAEEAQAIALLEIAWALRDIRQQIGVVQTSP